MPKRIDGEGSIYKTKSGQWKVALSVGRLRGRRKRITRNAISRADAVAKLEQLRSELKSGRYREKSTKLVDDFLTEWINHITAHKAPSTAELWRGIIDLHVRKHFVGMKVIDVDAMSVQAFVDDMAAAKVPGRTKQVAFEIFRMAMSHARKLNLISENPTLAIDKPSHNPKRIDPFSKEEADKIIKATQGTRWHAVIVLTMLCGFRQGELWGLHWEAVDLKRRKIEIRQAAAEVRGRVSIRKPKTDTGNRVVELPQAAIDALVSHRAIMLREGNAGSDLVFPAPKGGLMPRSIFRFRYWKPLLERLGMKPRGFHHARHTYAALALAANVPINVVSKVMGHSLPSTTLNCYGHLMPNQQQAATEAMQRLFG